jgi:chaperonin GroES
MQKIAEDEANGVIQETVEEPVQPFVAPKRKLKKFTPAGRTILVRQSAVEGDEHRFTDQAEALKSKTDGVLLIEKEEDKKADAPAEGVVLAVGPDADTVKEGDEIVFGKYAGAAFNLNGEWLLLMESKEVLGTLSTQDIETEEEVTYEAPKGDDYVMPIAEA